MKADCGTRAGYLRHVAADTKACARCKKANAAYMKDYRSKNRCARGLGWPLQVVFKP